jgi:16S rRNA (guanine527-N7)-methyltransferase
MDNHFLKKWTQQLNIHLTIKQFDQLSRYAETLVQWNQKMNITRLTSLKDIAIKHFYDSLAVLPFINQFSYESILDVGSGGGFPGLPLGIALPDKKITLLDASRKRIHFLKYVSDLLCMHNIHVCHDRLESFQSDCSYDIIISRAFANISCFANPSKYLLKDSGRIIAMKGKNFHDELQMFDSSGFHVTIESYTLPVIEQKRYLILLALK